MEKLKLLTKEYFSDFLSLEGIVFIPLVIAIYSLMYFSFFTAYISYVKFMSMVALGVLAGVLIGYVLTVFYSLIKGELSWKH